MTATLASLDYRTADAANATIASLIGAPTSARDRAPATQINGYPIGGQLDGYRDAELVAAARRIVAEDGRISQAALARELRSQGYTVANSRLHWLASASGLERPPGDS